jgi:Na+/proline symporter
VQRCSRAESQGRARRRSSEAASSYSCQFTLFLFIGLGLWAFYQGRPFTAHGHDLSDRSSSTRMPPGLVGLIIAAVVAATMSTHSGQSTRWPRQPTHDIYLPPDEALRRSQPETLRMEQAVRAHLGCRF